MARDDKSFDEEIASERATVVVADDDESVRLLLERRLTSAGHIVLLAENGEQALEAISTDTDVVILDLEMPVLDGLSSLERIRARREDISPIILTAHDALERAVSTMKAGAFDFLTKPFDTTELLSAVHKAVIASRQTRRLHQVETQLVAAREEELMTASQIQRMLLEGEAPSSFDRANVVVRSTPSKRVSGDFTDFFVNRDGSLDVIVADVMGKGLRAAFLGAAVKASLHRVLYEQALRQSEGGVAPLSQIVGAVNEALYGHLRELEAFVTMIVGRFDFRRRVLTFVDCGHMRTIHRTGNRVRFIQGGNHPLGFPQPFPFQELQRTFEPGDLFLFYSDGITEARGVEGELFGEERLKALVEGADLMSAEELSSYLDAELWAFASRERVADDVTSVVVQPLRVELEDEGDKGGHEVMKVNAELSSLAALRRDVRDFVMKTLPGRVDVPILDRIGLVVSEIATNIIEHGLRDNVGERSFSVELELREGFLEILFRDRGRNWERVDVGAPFFDGSHERGFGIYLTEELADSVDFGRDEEGFNMTTIGFDILGCIDQDVMV